MQIRTYANESDLFADYFAYDNRRDMQAGNRIAREIKASGVTLTELARAAAQFQRDAANPMAKVYAESPPVDQQDWHNAGIALDNDAQAIMRAKGCSYSEALMASRDRNPTSVMIYDRRRRPPAVSDEAVRRHASAIATQQQRKYEVLASVIISNLVANLPRLPDGSIDGDTAADAVNKFISVELRREAAEQQLQHLVDEEMSNQGTPGVERMKPEVIAALRRQVAEEHKGLDEAARTGNYGPEGIADLCWPLFRD